MNIRTVVTSVLQYRLLLLLICLLPVQQLQANVFDFDYPYLNDFEAAASVHDTTDSDSANDINGQSDWLIEGDWGINGSHNGWQSASGNFHLDNNPQEENQNGHNVGQLATMQGYVNIPANSIQPILSYQYQLQLYNSGDRMYVEIQSTSSPEWEVLTYYAKKHNHASHTLETLDLSDYQGQSIRIRFRQRNSNSGEDQARLWTLDDFYIGEQPLTQYDFPYQNDFESATSQGGINGRADWNTQANWGINGSHNGWQSASGDFHLDNNPLEESQNGHNRGQLATMLGYVNIPANTIQPILSYQYQLQLYNSGDRMYVEIQSTSGPEWEILTYYAKEHNYTNHTLETLDLSAYQGQSIRIRFRQLNSSGDEARLWTLDDFYIGEQPLTHFDFPYQNDFESATSQSGVNGRVDWNTQADWGINGSHNGWQSASGNFHLDNNPQEENQNGHNIGQLATLQGYVDIPVNTVQPVLSYQYQLQLTGSGDRMYVEIQSTSSPDWEILTYYTKKHNHASHTLETLDLSDYQGQSIRIRFRQRNSSGDEARLWTLDDVYIGEQPLTHYDFPYQNDFESATSQSGVNGRADWNIQADWGINGSHNGWQSANGNFHLDNNPLEESQHAHNHGQLATMLGYVNIPANTIQPILSYQYQLQLYNSGDRMYVEIQSTSGPEWEILTYYAKEHNYTNHTLETLDLSDYQGLSIRIRFRQRNSSGDEARLWTIDDLYIGEQPLTEYNFPYHNDFEHAASQSGINGRTDWNTQADWGINGSHSGWQSASGNFHLDNNPLEESQNGHNIGQLATLQGYVNIPLNSTQPVLSYQYQLQLYNSGDRMYVEIQSTTSPGWEVLTYYKNHNHTSHTLETLDLSAYKGQSIRIRFRQRNSNSGEDEARLWTIDNLSIHDTYTGSIVDDDGDGVNNSLDQCPSTPASAAVDSVGCSLSQLDSDDDGINDDLDLYPGDPLRWQLPSISNLAAVQQQSAVALSWSVIADVNLLAGYNIYRYTALETSPIKLTPQPISTTNYLDNNVANGEGYRYQVVAVDTLGREGAAHPAVNLLVAYNDQVISNPQLQRNGAEVHLSWDSLNGVAYQIYRAEGNGSFQPQQRTTQNSFVDDQLNWSQRYRYQIAALNDFTNPFTQEIISIAGPASAILEASAPSGLTLQLNNATQAADGVYELNVGSAQGVTLTGSYQHALGTVLISATSASHNLSSSASNGELRLVLPADGATDWQITLTEQQQSDRTISIALRLIKDQQPPVVTIDPPAQTNSQQAYFTLTGSVTDNRTITNIEISSDRHQGQSFGVVLGGTGRYQSELPLEYGDNLFMVTAVDGAGNSGQAQITITRTASLAPTLIISHPLNGSRVSSETISVQGRVITGQAPEQIRIILGDQQQFASAGNTANEYPFSFDNISLVEGYNLLTVRVETPQGNAEQPLSVEYLAQETLTSIAPQIDLDNETLNNITNRRYLTLKGSISSDAPPLTLTINDQEITLNASGLEFPFEHRLDLDQYSGDTIPVTLIATDSDGLTTSRTFTLYRDLSAPQIIINTPGLTPSPVVNRIVEQPYPLTGQVIDAHLSGFTLNGQNVSLTPGASPESYNFSLNLSLPLGVDERLSFEAWDRAGNQSSHEMILNADIPLSIEIIAPIEESEYLVNGTHYTLDIAARLTGLGAQQSVKVIVDEGLPQLMTLDGNAATATLSIAATDGEHTLTIQVEDASQQIIAEQSRTITFVNEANIPLTLLRHEPLNAEQGIEPLAFIGLYFNKPIDPSLLQLNVRQTAHGRTYDLESNLGSTPLTDGNTLKQIEVNYQQAPVAGGLSALPGNNTLGFYPQKGFAYNADIYVDVIYDGSELKRFTFKTRAMPTHLQGFVADALGQPIPGITVTLPDLGLSNTSNREGSYTFGLGETAANNLPSGRHRILYNPGRKNPRYGEIESWINLEAGQLNHADMMTLPIIGTELPFQQLRSGKMNTFAQGELVIDLSSTVARFPDGRNSGTVQIQFTPVQKIPFRMQPAIAPHWLYALQPGGIQVSEGMQLTLAMPALYGSHDYLPPTGTRVLLVGFDNQSKQIIPIGIGQIDGKQIHSVGTLKATSLNYLGYVLKDVLAEAELQRYQAGEISFTQLISILNTLAQPNGQ